VNHGNVILLPECVAAIVGAIADILTERHRTTVCGSYVSPK
jgi:hypothetical protein